MRKAPQAAAQCALARGAFDGASRKASQAAELRLKTLGLRKIVRDVVERELQPAADKAEGRDGDNRDQGSNQAVLNGGGAAFILKKAKS
jgi:hypothetical protein